MIRCPYCGSTNTTVLPMGDYLCLDCDEQFYKGERAPRRCTQSPVQKISGRVLSLAVKHGPALLKAGKASLPAILKGALVFF